MLYCLHVSLHIALHLCKSASMHMALLPYGVFIITVNCKFSSMHIALHLAYDVFILKLYCKSSSKYMWSLKGVSVYSTQ